MVWTVKDSARQATTNQPGHAKTRMLILGFAVFSNLFASAYGARSPFPPRAATPFSPAAFAGVADLRRALLAASTAQTSETSRLDLEAAAKAYTTDPTYEHGLALAAAEISAGESLEAKALLEKLGRQRESVELRSLLGKANTAAGDYRAAAIDFQKAAELDPTEANIFDFGTSLFRLDHGSAITILRYGLQKYPQSIRLRVALGTVLYADGNSLEGARMLCDAEDLDPSDPHPVEVLADTEIVPPELAARLTAQFAALQRRYPNDGIILFDYTMVRSGRWSEQRGALPTDFADSLRRALRLSPNLHQAYFQLSQVAAEHEDFAEQIRLLKKAISLAPNRANYHYQLAFAYKNSGDEQNFRKEMKQFQQLHAADLNTR